MTPGGNFGLEFTSLMATLAVSLFVLVAYAVLVGRDPGPTPGDQTAIDVVEHLRSGWLTISKVVTFLGSGVFTWGLTASARRSSPRAGAGPSSGCCWSG